VLSWYKLNALLSILNKVKRLSHLENDISKESTGHLKECQVPYSISGGGDKECLVTSANWYGQVKQVPMNYDVTIQD